MRTSRRIPSASCRPSEAGTALPLALLVLAAIYLLAAAGFLGAALERRIAETHEASVGAFYAADGRLHEALGRLGTGSSSGASGPVDPAGGSTASTLLALPAGDTVWRLHGWATARAGARRERTARHVEVLALLPSLPNPPAALTSTASVVGAGDGLVSGHDVADPGACEGAPGPALAGLLLPDGSPAGASGVTFQGAPAVRTEASPLALRRLTGFAWTDLVGPDGPAWDARVPAEPWPGYAPQPPGEVPAVLVSGDAAPGTLSGLGGLVVTGDLWVGSGFEWRGLVLVGGTLHITGAARLRGAALAGLDPDRSPGPAVRWEGEAAELHYDGCAARQAALRLRPPAAALPGTWRERMP